MWLVVQTINSANMPIVGAIKYRDTYEEAFELAVEIIMKSTSKPEARVRAELEVDDCFAGPDGAWGVSICTISDD